MSVSVCELVTRKSGEVASLGEPRSSAALLSASPFRFLLRLRYPEMAQSLDVDEEEKEASRVWAVEQEKQKKKIPLEAWGD